MSGINLENIVGIDETGNICRYTITKRAIAPFSAVASEYATRAPVTLPGLDKNTFMSLSSSGEEIFMSRVIDTLVFNTSHDYGMGDGDVAMLEPTFQYIETPLTTKWDISKENMLGLFTIRATTAPDNFDAPIAVQAAYLWLFRAPTESGGEPEIWQAPFPNIYQQHSGKLCTGSMEFNPAHGTGTLMSSYYEAWCSNKWNSDLADEGNWRNIIRYDLETTEQLPGKDGWEDKLYKPSRSDRVAASIRDMTTKVSKLYPNNKMER